MSKAINIKDALTPSLLKEVISNELLKEIMTDALVARGNITQGSLNGLTTPGVYSLPSGTEIEGLPKGAYKFGNITVERGQTYIFQIYRTTTGIVYQRRKHIADDWDRWYLIASGSPLV